MNETNNSKENNKYWQHLFAKNFPTHKIWLEGVGISKPLNKSLQCINYKKYLFTIPKTLTVKLNKFATQNHLPIDILFISAFSLLLHRLSASPEVVFAIADKSFANKNKQKDFNINLPFLTLRSETHPPDSILNFTEQLAHQIQNHKNHLSSLPLEMVPAHLDKLNYFFIYIDTEENQLSQTFETLSPQFHSLLFLFDRNNPSRFNLLFNRDLYAKKSLDSIAEHFITIIEKIIHTASDSVTSFDFLTKTEKVKLLKNCCPKSKINIKTCAHDLITKISKKYPTNLALCQENLQIKYKELEEYSNQLARFLIQEGIEPGDKVAVLMERTPYSIIAFIAILKIGATYVPINPRYSEERRFYILNDCKPKIILTNQIEIIPLEMQYKGIFFENFNSLVKFDKSKLNIKVLPEQIAYIVYTYGKSSKPKGVMIRHYSLVNLISAYQRNFKIKPKDRSSQFSSQGFDTYFCEILPFLSFGASVHLIDDNIKFIPSIFIPWLKNHAITFCDLPTAYAQILFSETWPKELHLRILKLGGDRLTRLPAKKMGFDIWNTFGTTETTIEAIMGRVYEANTKPTSKAINKSPPVIGKPIPNVEAYVVDSFKQAVPVGVAGELLIGGLCLAAGFINKSDLTNERFIQNPFKNIPERLYKTGDIVRWLPTGNLEYIGQLQHQIQIKGHQVHLNEIEATISQFPDVSEVIVMPYDMNGHQQTLVAYLVPNMEKIRIPYHVSSVIEIKNNANKPKLVEVLTEDISKEGLALTGLSETLPINQMIKINIKLPGMDNAHWFKAEVIWQNTYKAGIRFAVTSEEYNVINESIKHFLLTHNLMDVLYNVSSKRNLRKALRARLPEYMIPAVVNVLPSLPLTFNGKIDLKALPSPHESEKLIEKNMILPKTETEKKLSKMWKSILNSNEVSMTDSFFDLGGTSYTLTNFLLNVEKDFGVIISPHVLIDLPYIPIIAEYIDTHGKQYAHQSPIQQEIRHDLLLPEDIAPKNHAPVTIKNILLTGASGFLGIFMLREILNQSSATIYALVKPSAKPLEEFAESVVKYNLSNDISLHDKRLVIMAADIGTHNLGLSPEDYNQLSENVDIIYDCEARSNLTLSYPSVRRTNVMGTMELIRFASYKKTKHINYISAFDAATNTDTMGNYIEDFPKNSEAPHLVGGYAISKWVSERLLSDIKNRGLPVSIFRSGHIAGASDSGVTHTNDSFLYLIKGCIQLGCAPNWNEKVPILPIDFVSRVIVTLSFRHPDKSHVYHIEDPQGIMWTDLIAWLNNYGYNIGIISEEQWRNKLLKITAKNVLYPLLAFYLSPKRTPPEANMQNAIRILEQLEISYPKIDNDMLTKHFDFLCKIGFLPNPSETTQDRKPEVRKN